MPNISIVSLRKVGEKRFHFQNLGLENTTFYKGVAILLIVFHNFFHWLPPYIGENEQDFSPERVNRFLHVFMNQPEYSIQALFSFLGHYGVQIFLFLSAYGLTKKYSDITMENFNIFIKKRLLKIYPAFLFSVFLYFLYFGLTKGGLPAIIEEFTSIWKSLLLKLSLLANFYPGQLYSINGPWWFVSLIVQFYIIFPLLLSLYRKYDVKALVTLSISGLLLTALLQPLVPIPLPGTILTHLPEICLGIFMASRKNFSINYMALAVIFVVFILSNFFQFFWYFSFLTATLVLLIFIQWLDDHIHATSRQIVLFIGGISMYIFYLNGFMRHPWIESAKFYSLWYMNILLSFLFIIIVVAVSYLSSTIDKKTGAYLSARVTK